MGILKSAFVMNISIDPTAKYVIASCSKNNSIVIGNSKSTKLFVLNRIGQIIKDFRISNPNTGVENLMFHKNGHLAVIGNKSVSVYEDFTELVEISTNAGKPVICAWSKDGTFLGIGTDKGAIIIYDFNKEKKLSLDSLHSKCVTSLNWSSSDILLSGSEDKQIHLTDSNGRSNLLVSSGNDKKLLVDSQNLQWVNLAKIFSQIKNTNLKNNFKSPKTICCMFNKSKNILLHDLESYEKPIQLLFAKAYGSILDFRILSSGYLIVIFENGQVSLLSLLNSEINQEINSKKLFSEKIYNYSFSVQNNYLVASSKNLMKVFDLNQFEEVKKLRIRFDCPVKHLNILSCDSAVLVLLTSGQIHSILINENKFESKHYFDSSCYNIISKKSYNVLQLIHSDQSKDQ
jgi:hypothetical protein